ncbi:hypothetical protein VPH35_100085 [Triticum aestivum]
MQKKNLLRKKIALIQKRFRNQTLTLSTSTVLPRLRPARSTPSAAERLPSPLDPSLLRSAVATQGKSFESS